MTPQMPAIRTHTLIDWNTCGKPVATEKNSSRVELKTTEKMAVDEAGLVHGGFVFSLADHAAMIAVNHPNVVLGSAEVAFLKPVKAGALLQAEARVTDEKGKKKTVSVAVFSRDEKIFEGQFTCFVLSKHVLA